MSQKNTINYATRDFVSLVAQFNSDIQLKQSPAWIKNMIGGAFDVLNNTLNALANSMFIRTAYARTVLQDVLQLVDYQLDWKQNASVLLTVNINPALTASSSYTVLKANLKFQSPGTTTRSAQQFEGLADLTFPMGTSQTSILVKQQATQPAANLGSTDGTNWQLFDLPDVDVLKDTLVITIGADVYARVTTFANYGPADKVFKIYYRTDGSSYIKLGGVDTKSGAQFGFIPASGQSVNAVYATGGGADGNVEVDAINQYIGADSGVTTINNSEAADGGSAEESIANARELAPLRTRETGYFVNESTGISLAKSIDGVLKASIVRTGLLAVAGYIIPNGGGYPSTTLKNAVRDLLIARSPLEDITVVINDPTYIPTAVTLNIKLYPGFLFSNIQKYCALAIVMKAHEIADTIQTTYQEQGIDACIAMINADIGSITGTFQTAVDGVQISDIMNRIVPIKIGEDLQLEDIITACGFVKGVDYVKITAPSGGVTSFPGGQIKVTSVTATQI